MAKQIVWTEQAENQRIEIFNYWNNRNGSHTYSKKLNKKINKSVSTILNFPESGKLSRYMGIRVKIIRDYHMFYKESNNIISILAFVDMRRDPKTIDKLVGKWYEP